MTVRVLQVLGYSTWGGATFSVLELAKGLKQEGFDVHVASPRGDADLSARLARLDIPWTEVDLAGRYDVRSLLRLVRLMRRERIDVVHTHCRNADLIGGVAAKIARVPGLVAHIRGLLVDSRGQTSGGLIDRLHRRFLAHGPDRLIAISDAVRQRTLSLLSRDEADVSLVRNGVDLQHYAGSNPRARKSLRDSLSIREDQCLLLNIGQLSQCKGQDVLLRALKEVPTGHRWVLALIGEGPHREKLQTIVRNEGFEGRVHFLGSRDDVADWMTACDVYVHPSRWEGFGRVVVEAMAASRPVIASDVGGLSEVVSHGVSGLKVPKDSPTALADALTVMMADRDKRAAMGQAGFERARDKFDCRVTVRGCARVLEDVLKSRVPDGVRVEGGFYEG